MLSEGSRILLSLIAIALTTGKSGRIPAGDPSRTPRAQPLCDGPVPGLT